jgi:hypothetical protein
MAGRHRRKSEDKAAAHDGMGVEPQPGTAAMGQGQPDAGVEAPDEDKPEQPDNVVTGGEALEEQQQNPDLEDKGTNRGT